MSDDAQIAALEQEAARLQYALESEEIPERDRVREQLDEMREDVKEVEALLSAAKHAAREKSRSNQAIIEEHRSRINSLENFLSQIRHLAGNDVNVLQQELASMRETLFALRPRAADLADTLEAHARGAARRKKQAAELATEIADLERQLEYLHAPVMCVLTGQDARRAPGPLDEPYEPKLLNAPIATLGASGVAAAGRFGVQVTRITPGGPSEAGGLAVGDVIVSVGGHATPDEDVLAAEIARRSPGEPVVLGVLRPSLRGEVSAFAQVVLAPRETHIPHGPPFMHAPRHA